MPPSPQLEGAKSSTTDIDKGGEDLDRAEGATSQSKNGRKRKAVDMDDRCRSSDGLFFAL